MAVSSLVSIPGQAILFGLSTDTKPVGNNDIFIEIDSGLIFKWTGSAWVTFDVGGLSGQLAEAQKVTVRKNTGADVGSRKRLNFIEGANVTLTIADDAAGNEVDITVAAAAGGGGGAWNAFTQDLGTAHRSGKFTLTGLSGLTAGEFKEVVQTAAAITSRGDATDEPEMDMILATGKALSTTDLEITWYQAAQHVVVGTYAFAWR